MKLKIMKTLTLPAFLLGARRSAMSLPCDDRGSAAVEFAVIVPLMLVMFFGTVEFSSAVAVNRKISMVTQQLADLASRYTTVNDTDMTNFGVIGDAMLTPYSATPLKATITEIYIDPATGVARAQWSKGDVPRAVGTPVPLPANLIAKDAANKIIANQYLIFTETSYLYQPAVGYVMGVAGVTLSDKTYMRPRQGDCVLYNPTTPPPPCPKS
jgi:Flp pilus assembly protein TadG